jgi:hypothetical protein
MSEEEETIGDRIPHGDDNIERVAGERLPETEDTPDATRRAVRDPPAALWD